MFVFWLLLSLQNVISYALTCSQKTAILIYLQLTNDSFSIFPQEDYERLKNLATDGKQEGPNEFGKDLEKEVRLPRINASELIIQESNI